MASQVEEQGQLTEEDEKAKLMETCKVRACIDKFLMHLGLIDPDRLWKRYPKFSEIEDQDQLIELKNQLIVDLNHYIPHFLKDSPHLFKDGELDLDAQELTNAIYPRWIHWRVYAGKTDIFDSLFRRTAAKQQHARLLRGVHAEKDTKTSSLKDLAFTKACWVLRDSVELDGGAISFTCGGTIEIEGQPKVENVLTEVLEHKTFQHKALEHRASKSQFSENGSCENRPLEEPCEVRPTSDKSPEDKSSAQETSSNNSPEDEYSEDSHSDTGFAGRISPRIRIFWTNKEDPSNGRKLELPVNGTRGSNNELLQQLVTDCSPASFGRGNETVLDSSYRDAGKLDVDQFASSFHPADFGILENIERVLLPDISTKFQNRLPFRKLVANLYKLNVYSAPSGYFRNHVDTPSSGSQIGSLVVCLPTAFKGGNLIVRNYGREVIFDWSRRSTYSIHWAAFYSDCEHEINAVTEGHRITLTYNLIVTEPIESGISRNPVIDPQTLPLYGYIRSLIQQPGFMKDGGILGFGCVHEYAHTGPDVNELLPRTLKGPDFVVYSIFESLGFLVRVLPVIDQDDIYYVTNPSIGLGEKDWCTPDDEEFVERNEYLRDDYINSVSDDFQDCDDIEKRWQSLFDAHHTMEDMVSMAQELGKERYYRYRDYKCIAKVGKTLKPYFVLSNAIEGEEANQPDNEWHKFYWGAGITWISDTDNIERAFTGILHGTHPTTGAAYSCAAIFVIVQPWQERAKIINLA